MPEKIITLYFFDEFLKATNHQGARQTKLSTAEVMTVATVACEFFAGNYQRSLDFLISHGYIPAFSKIRFTSCRIYKDEAFRGYTASKKEYFYGLKVCLVITDSSDPVKLLLALGSTADIAMLRSMALDGFRVGIDECFDWR